MLVEMEHIWKSFSRISVLDGVHFDLKPSEVHILAGENGAGKTTLIKILAGVHTDYEGEITIRGKRVRFRSPLEAAHHGISVIHQEMSLVNSMRVADNIFLGREKTRGGLWMDYRTEHKRAQELLAQLDIQVDLNRQASEYPISVRQMIEIAKALVYEARIFIMDEPTSALTKPEVGRLFDIIASLKERGCGIIYISHRLEEIFRIGDRVSVLRDGKYVGTSLLKELFPEELIQMIVGREIRQQFPPRSPQIREEKLNVRHFSLPDPLGAKRRIVEDVSLSIRAGEILGIAGLQGSGKSELLNGLFGSCGKKVEGTVLLDNKPFKIQSPQHSIRNGLVLQTNDRKGTGLVTSMNIARNLTLPSLREFSPWGWILFRKEQEAAEKHVQNLGIRAASLDQEVRTLSGGNQQKVVLAKWIETRPKVMFLDEPTLGVDVGAKHEIYSLMNELTAQGMAILLITSELPELLAMSDRILVMHRGRVTAEFSRTEATQEKLMHAAMGERMTS